MTESDRAAFLEDGFLMIPDVLDEPAIHRLVQELEDVGSGEAVRQRRGEAFGIRNLLDRVPLVREIARSEAIRSWVVSILGEEARGVRGLYFDKTAGANWKVPWHQDMTIAVHRRVEAPGYGPWSVKAGVVHVQPPARVLEAMLAVRLHLDDVDESNGALRVMPGSHRRGRLAAHEIARWKEGHSPVVCPVKRGGVMLMRPLLLHASSPAILPFHRRVVHLEYSSATLAEGLEWREG